MGALPYLERVVKESSPIGRGVRKMCDKDRDAMCVEVYLGLSCPISTRTLFIDIWYNDKVEEWQISRKAEKVSNQRKGALI